MDVITGKGLHSIDNKPKLLPAVIAHLDKEGFKYEVKRLKDGVMVDVNTDTGQSQAGGSYSEDGWPSRGFS